MTRINKRALLLGCIATFAITSVEAHHSAAGYDHEKMMALTGVVKEFKYTNPHAWIYMMVPDGKGGEQQWDLEGGSINMLVRNGWTRDTIKPGMTIKVRIAPRRDGTPGGEWWAVLEIDGKPFAPAGAAK